MKTQAYLPASVNPADPQAAWLVQSALSEDAHRELKAHAEAQGAKYFASVFDKASAFFIAQLCGRIKIASTEAMSDWWQAADDIADDPCYVSFPWGINDCLGLPKDTVRFATVPLYPTPLEAMRRVEWMPGWSDHCVGLAACYSMIHYGSTFIEVHVSLPGEGRNCVFDKTQDDLKRIKDWMGEVQVMRTGVSKTFRQRWVR